MGSKLGGCRFLNSSSIFLVLWGAVAGFSFGPSIAWAIRSLPGHEALLDHYLRCHQCRGGLKRGCYNAGGTQDLYYAIFSGVTAALSLLLFGIGSKAFLSWIFSVSCLIITVVDIRFLIIPDTLSINGCYLGLLYSLGCYFWVIQFGFAQPEVYITLWDSIMGFLIGGGFLWILGWLAWIILKKEGMGGGDVKLLAAGGAWMGWKPVLGTVIIASVLGSIGGISGILYNRIFFNQKYKPLTHMIPFGPYLCFGFLFVFYAGMEPLYILMGWYHEWLETRAFGGR